jgi:hypothetical protein
MTSPESLDKKEEIARIMGYNGDWYIDQFADSRLTLMDKVLDRRRFKALQTWAQTNTPLRRSTIMLMEEMIFHWRESSFPEIKWFGDVLNWMWTNNIGDAELKIASTYDPELRKALEYFANNPYMNQFPPRQINMTMDLRSFLLRKRMHWEVANLIALKGFSEEQWELTLLAQELMRTHPSSMKNTILDPEIIWKLLEDQDPFIHSAALSYHRSARELLRHYWGHSRPG